MSRRVRPDRDGVPKAPLERTELVTEPGDLHRQFAVAFNKGDDELIERFFEAGAILVPSPGEVLAGPERRRAMASFVAMGLPMELTPQHTYVSGDVALLISRHRVRGTTADGERVLIEGTSADVARRGLDGGWRIVIDNPPGTAQADGDGKIRNLC